MSNRTVVWVSVVVLIVGGVVLATHAMRQQARQRAAREIAGTQALFAVWDSQLAGMADLHVSNRKGGMVQDKGGRDVTLTFAPMVDYCVALGPSWKPCRDAGDVSALRAYATAHPARDGAVLREVEVSTLSGAEAVVRKYADRYAPAAKRQTLERLLKDGLAAHEAAFTADASDRERFRQAHRAAQDMLKGLLAEL